MQFAGKIWGYKIVIAFSVRALQCYHELFSSSYIQFQPVVMTNPQQAHESGTRCNDCYPHRPHHLVLRRLVDVLLLLPSDI